MVSLANGWDFVRNVTDVYMKMPEGKYCSNPPLRDVTVDDGEGFEEEQEMQ